jgi:hypothetical protein
MQQQKRVLIHYIGLWSNQRECVTVDEIALEASQTLKMMINHQTKLGWDQWFYGRLSIHWGEMYKYDRTHSTKIIRESNTRPMSTVKWGISLIEMGWQFLIVTWIHRNNEEHNSNNNPDKRKKEKLIEKIMWIKSQFKNVPDHDKDLNPETTMKYPVNNLSMLSENISNNSTTYVVAHSL